MIKIIDKCFVIIRSHTHTQVLMLLNWLQHAVHDNVDDIINIGIVKLLLLNYLILIVVIVGLIQLGDLVVVG